MPALPNSAAKDGNSSRDGDVGGIVKIDMDRTTYRNGYRDRTLDTCLGSLQLRIPKLRQGSYFPPFLEPRKTSEKALVAVIQEAWVSGVSTRRVDELVQAMGLSGISKSTVSKLCKDIDERVGAFLDRPLVGEWPYLWLDATYLRCRVHWMRNALSYVPKGQQSMVSAALRQAFIQPDRAHASQTLRHVADQLRQKWPKLAAFIDESEADMLAHLDFPIQHRSKIHSTNPLERLNKEVKRRADVVGIFPNEGAIIHLVGAVLLEANDEWQLQHRYMQTEAMTELTPPLIEADPTQISTKAA
jgi:transposase-like protein